MSLTGECDRCGRYTSNLYLSENDTLIPRPGVCYNCYEKYYSPESMQKNARDQKLKKLLKKPWWKFWD